MAAILRVEMDRLESLAQTLHGLAAEAGAMSTVGAASDPLVFATAAQTGLMTTGKGLPTSVTEALSIAHDLVDGALVPTVTQRLNDTGDKMTSTAKAFRDTESSLGQAAAAYTKATGDWVVAPVAVP